MTVNRRRRGPRALLGVLAVSLGVLFTPAAVSAPAFASQARPHLHLLPITGSSKVLIYAQSQNPINPFSLDKTTEIYALTSSGQREPLGQAGHNVEVTVAGSNVDINSSVTVDDQYGYEFVRWWDLATGRHGSFRARGSYYAAAPDGWTYLVEEGGSEHIFWRTYSGTLTDLGDPQPIGSGYLYEVSATGIIATGDNDENGSGRISYMPWSHPGRFRVLYKSNGVENYCAAPSPRYAVCELDYYPEALLPLDGGKPTIKPARCSRDSEVLGNTSVWMTVRSDGQCPNGQLGSLSSSGKVAHSKGRFSEQPVVIAFGRIVVANKSQQSLLTLTSVTARPKTLHVKG